MKSRKISSMLLLGAIIAFGVGAQNDPRSDLENLRLRDASLTAAYDKILLQPAWDAILAASPPLSDVIVGIVDTGIALTHQEFNNPDVQFFSFGGLAFVDPTSHGTSVAGMIGANNVLGSGGAIEEDSPQMNGILSGVLREEQYTLRVEDMRTNQTMQAFAALESVLEANPAVVNMSFGYYRCSVLPLLLRDRDCLKTDTEFDTNFLLFNRLFALPENQDTLFVSAAGNVDTAVDRSIVPAAVKLSNTITVAATDLQDNRAKFIPALSQESSFGAKVDIAAPGGDGGVYALRADGGYRVPGFLFGFPTGFSETSAAAPFVTGVAGLIKAINPALTPAEMKQILIQTADPIETGETDKRLGTGCYADPNDPVNTGCRLNAHAAVCHPLVLDCDPVKTVALGSSFGRPGAAADGVFLAVWPQAFPDETTGELDWKLLAQRVDDSGNLLDQEPILLVDPPGERLPETPTVAFSNDVFMVVWTEREDVGRVPEVYGIRLDEDGNTLDAGPQVLLTRGPNGVSNLSLATHPNGFFLSWTEPQRLHAATLRADATVVDQMPLSLFGAPGFIRPTGISASCQDTDCTIVWTSRFGIRAFGIDTTQEPNDWRGSVCANFLSPCPGILLFQPLGQPREPFAMSNLSVAPRDGGFIASWFTRDGHMVRRFNKTSTTFIDGERLVGALVDDVATTRAPAITQFGNQTLIVALEDIPAQVIGGVIDENFTIPITLQPFSDNQPVGLIDAAPACTADRCIVVWRGADFTQGFGIFAFVGVPE